MKIRIFEERDRVKIIDLWQQCDLSKPWNDPNKDIDRKIQFQPELFLVGVINDSIIASAMAGYDGHRGSVNYLAVHPEHQGCGYGQRLMDYIESLLITMDCPKLNLAVRSSNDSVLRFYTKLSYSTDDVLSLGKRLIPDA